MALTGAETPFDEHPTHATEHTTVRGAYLPHRSILPRVMGDLTTLYCVHCGCAHRVELDVLGRKMTVATEVRPCPSTFEHYPCVDCGWAYVHAPGCARFERILAGDELPLTPLGQAWASTWAIMCAHPRLSPVVFISFLFGIFHLRVWSRLPTHSVVVVLGGIGSVVVIWWVS